MTLTLALAKGRILDEELQFLTHAGISISREGLNSRRLKIANADGGYDFVFARGPDVPTYVEYGVADMGICGRDVLLEADADVHQPLHLPLGFCKLVVAGLPGGAGRRQSALSTVRVATKYPRVAESHFRDQGIPVEIVPLAGSVELAPGLGLCDCIVDVVQTGQTLAENGLVVYEVVAESSAQVIVNRASYHLKQAEVLRLLKLFEATARGQV